MLPFCYGFVLFSLFFAIFLLSNLVSAKQTSAPPAYRTLSQIYLYGIRLYYVICVQTANYSHFFFLLLKGFREKNYVISLVKEGCLPSFCCGKQKPTMSPLRKQGSRAKKLDSHFRGNDKYCFRNRNYLRADGRMSPAKIKIRTK